MTHLDMATVVTSAPPASAWHLPPDHGLRTVGRRAFALGAAGAALSALGALLDPVQFLRSYLVAYLFFVGAALGCLAVLMIQYITGGAWGAAVRRLLESGARTLPFMAVLFVPVLLGVSELYEWARPTALDDPLLVHKRPYLNVPFFVVRAAVYFGAWTLVVRLLVRWSHEQDATGAAAPARRLELLSRGGLVLLGLTMTFASVDWAMSLEPHWFSTIYGVLFMGGSVLTAFAIVIAVGASLAERDPVARVITAEHFHDLGKLLLAFVMLWAYFSFSQFLIVWSGNLPEETPWYLRRLEGGWQWLGLGLILFHFGLPFVLLLSRTVKRQARTLAALAVALLGVRLADVFWMIAPAFASGGLTLHWLDVTAVLGIGGVWLGLFVWRLAEGPVVPLNDPALPVDAGGGG
jgi:hypothetical protein